MLVVADSSPVRYLRVLDCIHVLPVLFERLLIPQAVLRELQHSHTPAVVRTWMAARPPWLEVRPILGQPDATVARLEAGEQEASVLAQELQADILLVDDGKARDVAIAQGLTPSSDGLAALSSSHLNQHPRASASGARAW
jgi:predicted nucleic acid-binding protein